MVSRFFYYSLIDFFEIYIDHHSYFKTHAHNEKTENEKKREITCLNERKEKNRKLILFNTYCRLIDAV